MTGEDTTIYRQKITFCGKPGCRACQEGRGHGPYWYAYRTTGGRTTQTYVGKTLPPEARARVEDEPPQGGPLLRLYTLGRLRLERRTRGRSGDWYPIRDISWDRPVRVVLCSLLTTPHRSLSLAEVQVLLSRENVSLATQQVIADMRRLLETPMRKNQRHVLSERLLDVAGEQLSLAGQERLWIDADAFEALLAEAREVGDRSVKEQRLSQALLLYQGDFWPDIRPPSWLRERREHLRRQWTGALLQQADLRAARGARAEAIDTLDRLLATDMLNEAAVTRLVVLLALAQRRGEALRLYQRYTTLLEEEQGSAPSERARALYEALRHGVSLDAWYPGQSTTLETPPDLRGVQPGAAEQPGRLVPPNAQEVIPVGRPGQRPLVGRETERLTLHSVLQEVEQAAQARQGEQTPRATHCTLLSGDVGIGKTRLAEEMAREAQLRGWQVLWIRAYPQESDFPYHVWAEVLRRAALLPVWPRQAIAERPHLYAALEALLPEIPGLPSAQALPAMPEPEPLRLWEAVRDVLEAMSEQRPLCLVLDDLQWMDKSSSDLLGYLVRHLRDMPVVLIGTLRESELTVPHPLSVLLLDLRRDQVVRTITLAPLSREQISVLVSDLPEATVSTIQEVAGGNPLFAEELARAARVSPLVLSQHAALPDSIAAALNLRLARLSQDCQRLLTRAAILGGSFAFTTLALLESGTTPVEDRLVDLLDEAIQAGVLIEEGNGTRTTYTIWHPLAISHLTSGLSAPRRASLHRRAAEVLQQVYRGREEEGAAAIASHLVNGGAEPPLIVHYAELAGDYAYRLSAYPEAERHYHLALDAREMSDAARSQAPDDLARLALLVERLGECAMVQGQYGEAEQCYARVVDLRSANRLEGEAQLLALCWAEIGWAKRYLGEIAQAWQYHQRGEALLRQVGVVGGPALASLRYQYGNFAWQDGRYQEAEQAALEALTLFEQHLQRASPPHPGRASTRLQRTLAGNPADPGRVHILLAAILATVGQSAKAAAHLQTALLIFEQEDHSREIAIVSGNLGDLYLRQGEYELAQASFRRSLSIAERMGDLPIQSVGYGNLGVLAGRLGNQAEAERQLRRALQLAERVADPVYQCLWLTYLALSLQEAGNDEEAKNCLLRALNLGRAKALTACVGFSLVTLGQVRLAQARNTRGTGAQQEERDAATRLLFRARSALSRALANGELEAEMRVEGQAALAEVLLLLGERDLAAQQARQALSGARLADLPRLVALAERLLERLSA